MNMQLIILNTDSFSVQEEVEKYIKEHQDD